MSPGERAAVPRAGLEPSGALRLTGRTLARAELAPRVRDAMYALMDRHFAGVDRDTFDADLAEKDHVILLEDAEGEVRGFSTLLTYRSLAAGAPLTIVYSGDTIVDRAAWGSSALARTWIRAVADVRRRHPHGLLYWLLLTSGPRTYRMLPVFFRDFFPRYDQPTPPAPARIIEALARERFGARFDRAAGIVRFARPQALRSELADVSDAHRDDPHVACFLARNPDYARGDELVCLTRIDDDNLTAAGRRMAGGVLRA